MWAGHRCPAAAKQQWDIFVRCPAGQQPPCPSVPQPWSGRKGSRTQAFPNVKPASTSAVFSPHELWLSGRKPAADPPLDSQHSGGALLPPGWVFNRDVFCKLRNGNSQSFLSQRTQRKQKAKSQTWWTEPLFRGPSWEIDCSLLHLALGPHMWPASFALLPNADPRQQCSLLRQCFLVCVSVCLQGSGVQGTKP